MVDHIDQVDADFRVFYRMPEDGGPGVADGVFPEHLSAPRFFTLAEQLPAYKGAVRAWVESEAVKEAEANGGSAGMPPSSSRPVEVPDNVAAAHQGFAGDASSGFPPVFDVHTAGKGVKNGR